jgi:flagellar biosynthesis protein
MEKNHVSPGIPGKKASAVGYNSEEGVPRLLAKARAREAERMIALAREAGIEIVEDPALAVLLDAGLEPGDWIPPWCWEGVAKILAFVFSKENPEKKQVLR